MKSVVDLSPHQPTMYSHTHSGRLRDCHFGEHVWPGVAPNTLDYCESNKLKRQMGFYQIDMDGNEINSIYDICAAFNDDFEWTEKNFQ